MKLKITLAIASFLSLNFYASAQSDLSIHFDEYSSGTTIGIDTIYTSFNIQNHGNIDFHIGDTIYVSSRINNMYFGIDLLGQYTPLVLDDHFHTGGSLSVVNGYLLGSQTLAFFPGATTLDICLIVWGEGIASVDIANGTFPADSDPLDNTTCVTYDPSQLGILDAPVLLTNVFPNPASNLVSFQFAELGNYRICILNALGQQVSEKCVINDAIQTVDLSSFAEGLYSYTVLGENGQVLSNGKFIKR